jgi:hypothetical protein
LAALYSIDQDALLGEVEAWKPGFAADFAF